MRVQVGQCPQWESGNSSGFLLKLHSLQGNNAGLGDVTSVQHASDTGTVSGSINICSFIHLLNKYPVSLECLSRHWGCHMIRILALMEIIDM